VFHAVRDNAASERRRARPCFSLGRAIGQGAREGGHLGDPSPILLLLDLDFQHGLLLAGG